MGLLISTELNQNKRETLYRYFRDRMDFFSAPDETTPAPQQDVGQIEEIEIIAPEESSPPVDLSAEFAELEDVPGGIMQEDDLRRMTTQGEAVVEEVLDPSAMYSGISMADDRISQLKMESDAVREWRDRNTKRIEDGDNKEKSDVIDWKEQAKLQKEEFYKQYETENSKRKRENRNAESVSASNAPNTREDAWKQLGTFIDFQATRAANETDKSRMKSLLFKLKQTPPKITA